MHLVVKSDAYFFMPYKIITLIILITINAGAQTPAFPGAEGFGMFASGGRGGRVIQVTNLNDRGPGSLRDAVEQQGARTIVFEISGNIELESELKITSGSLTIAGQTAPGGGICIKNFVTSVTHAENIIIRYIRFRPGDLKKQADDALNIMNCRNVIIDHCSLSWGTDEVLSCYDNENTTVQWCIISEALNNSYHPKGEHGYGGIWGGKNASFHHNLLAHNASRNPRFNGSRTKYSPSEEKVDFRNNVIYNWGFNSAYGGESASYNIVANYYKAGPGTKKNVRSRIIEPWDSGGKWFIKDNFVFGFPEATADNWKGGVQGKFSACRSIKAEKAFDSEMISTDSSEAAFSKILLLAGANLPERDKVDIRIAGEVKSGTVFTSMGIIDTQEQVGGWPDLKPGAAAVDNDSDGIPDQWEISHKLNPEDPGDASNISENGYTFVEEYLNDLCK